MSLADVRHHLSVWCAELDLDPEQLLDKVSEVQQLERDRIVTRGAAGQEPYAAFLARGAPMILMGTTRGFGSIERPSSTAKDTRHKWIGIRASRGSCPSSHWMRSTSLYR